MLTKQWQIGEFKADDAGSPVFAKVCMRAAPVTRYQPGDGAAEPFAPNVPLETKAEQRILRWEWNGQKMHLDLRAQLGRQWRDTAARRRIGNIPIAVSRLIPVHAAAAG